MTVIQSAVRTWCGKHVAVPAMLGLSLLSIQCSSRSPVPRPDAQSIGRCSQIAPQHLGVRYLATALPSGAYSRLGHAIAEISRNNPETTLEICTSDGSRENLKLLDQGVVQFALVQLDTLHYAVEGAHDDDDVDDGHYDDDDNDLSLKKVRLATFLYSEKLHLFVRPHLYLNSPADLVQPGGAAGAGRGARVWLGPRRSGARQTARRVLQAAGVSPEDLQSFDYARQYPSADMAANCLLAPTDQSLVAYFRMMPVPRPSPRSDPGHEDEPRRLQTTCPEEGATQAPPLLVDDLLEADAQLLPLPPALIDRLTEDRLYVRTRIELGSYRRLKRGVATVGIPTVLLTNLPDSDAAGVRALIGEIERGKDLIEASIDGVELDQFDRTDKIPGIPPHPGALKHLQPRGSGLPLVGVLALGLVGLTAWRHPSSFRRGLAAGAYGLVLTVSMWGICLLLSIAMMLGEGRLNPEFSTATASFLNTLGLVVRLHDYHLMTPEGETWKWLGLLLFPVILGWLLSDVIKGGFRRAAARLARTIRRAQVHHASQALIASATGLRRMVEWLVGKPPATQGPLVFLNWNCRAERLAEEFLEDAALADHRIVVVRPDGAAARGTGDRDGRFSFVQGDPASRAAMVEAGVLEASNVTIVSAWAPTDPHDRRRNVDPEYADSKTILTILAIRALCEDGNRSGDLPITAEIRLARNQQEARNAVQGGPLSLTCVAV